MGMGMETSNDRPCAIVVVLIRKGSTMLTVSDHQLVDFYGCCICNV